MKRHPIDVTVEEVTGDAADLVAIRSLERAVALLKTADREHAAWFIKDALIWIGAT